MTSRQVTAQPTADTVSAPLASFKLANSDTIEFAADSVSGETFWFIRTTDEENLKAFVNSDDSPLRLFLALAPANLAIPQSLVEADKTPEKNSLIATRSLTNRLSEPVDLPTAKLVLPVQSGGLTASGDIGLHSYCGINGESGFKARWCDPEWDPEAGPTYASIYKCTSSLSRQIVHESIDDDGEWRRRGFVSLAVAICTDPVRIRHQYRIRTFGGWRWKDAAVRTFNPQLGVMTGFKYDGDIQRRRRVIYESLPESSLPVAGVRAWTKFKW